MTTSHLGDLFKSHGDNTSQVLTLGGVQNMVNDYDHSGATESTEAVESAVMSAAWQTEPRKAGQTSRGRYRAASVLIQGAGNSGSTSGYLRLATRFKLSGTPRVRGQFAATPFDGHAGEFRVCECGSNLDPFDMDPHDGKGDNKSIISRTDIQYFRDSRLQGGGVVQYPDQNEELQRCCPTKHRRNRASHPDAPGAKRKGGCGVDLNEGCNFEMRLVHDGTVEYWVDMGQEVEGAHVGVVGENVQCERQGEGRLGAHHMFLNGDEQVADRCAIFHTPKEYMHQRISEILHGVSQVKELQSGKRHAMAMYGPGLLWKLSYSMQACVNPGRIAGLGEVHAMSGVGGRKIVKDRKWVDSPKCIDVGQRKLPETRCLETEALAGSAAMALGVACEAEKFKPSPIDQDPRSEDRGVEMHGGDIYPPSTSAASFTSSKQGPVLVHLGLAAIGLNCGPWAMLNASTFECPAHDDARCRARAPGCFQLCRSVNRLLPAVSTSTLAPEKHAPDPAAIGLVRVSNPYAAARRWADRVDVVIADPALSKVNPMTGISHCAAMAVMLPKKAIFQTSSSHLMPESIPTAFKALYTRLTINLRGLLRVEMWRQISGRKGVRKSQAGEDKNQAAPEAVAAATVSRKDLSAKPGKSKMEGLNRDEEQRKNKRSMDIWRNSTASHLLKERLIMYMWTMVYYRSRTSGNEGRFCQAKQATYPNFSLESPKFWETRNKLGDFHQAFLGHRRKYFRSTL
ncbi:hypothetical protein DFH08DRAFT_799659 [Mycena albidolilacea]|uniref:Uncharacterized protein n=1 Tax=Mycena albidolilacea TaxID=1033008 RepID=A0AAD7F0L5_9AGAR|nr:hypothetical protein DFH08DRAFT_799659 [Mycena albidolilacea]